MWRFLIFCRRPWRRPGLKLYQEHFANARELIVTIRGKDAEQAEQAAASLGIVCVRAGFSDDGDMGTTLAEHPEQAAELIAYLWFNQPPDNFKALTHRLAPEKLTDTLTATPKNWPPRCPARIGRLSYDPFGLTRLPESATGAAPSFGEGQEAFSSKDGTFRILFVQAARECAATASAIIG